MSFSLKTHTERLLTLHLIEHYNESALSCIFLICLGLFPDVSNNVLLKLLATLFSRGLVESVLTVRNALDIMF